MDQEKLVEAWKHGQEAWEDFCRQTGEVREEISVKGVDLSHVPVWQSGPTIPWAITFERCTFKRWPFRWSPLDHPRTFKHCSFNGQHIEIGSPDQDFGAFLTFDHCVFNQEVTFMAQVGPLEATDCHFKFGVHLGKNQPHSINFLRSIVDRGLFAKGCRFDRFASFQQMHLLANDFHNPFIPALELSGSTFCGGVSFRGTKVDGVARFDDTTFKDHINFIGTHFAYAPIFSGAKLNADTQFNRPDTIQNQFPDVESDHARESYRTLKAHMSTLHAVGEQLAFYRLEMKADQVRHKGPSLIWLYEQTADYGLSWWRPLKCLIGTMGVFYLLFALCAKFPVQDIWPDILVFTLHNAFPFVGSFKSFVLEWDGLFTSPPLVAGLALLQNLVSGVFLFLIALGVRNTLRMR